jgi:hypothetical protein
LSAIRTNGSLDKTKFVTPGIDAFQIVMLMLQREGAVLTKVDRTAALDNGSGLDCWHRGGPAAGRWPEGA